MEELGLENWKEHRWRLDALKFSGARLVRAERAGLN